MEKIFELKEEHIKLLKKAYVGWQDCEYGAPEIDPKRPYGNSYVSGDIADILNFDVEDELTDKQEDLAWDFHKETEIALQIILSTLGEPIKFGKYRQGNENNDWRLV